MFHKNNNIHLINSYHYVSPLATLIVNLSTALALPFFCANEELIEKQIQKNNNRYYFNSHLSRLSVTHQQRSHRAYTITTCLNQHKSMSMTQIIIIIIIDRFFVQSHQARASERVCRASTVRATLYATLTLALDHHRRCCCRRRCCHRWRHWQQSWRFLHANAPKDEPIFK